MRAATAVGGQAKANSYTSGLLPRPPLPPQARAVFEEVLSVAPDHPPALLALARASLALGDVDACQARCVGLLRADPDNEAAAAMLAEIMFHQARRELHALPAGHRLLATIH